MAHWLYNIRSFTSKLDGNLSWELSFIDIDTAEEYRCYVSPTFRNYKKWQDVITTQPQAAIFQGLRLKKDTESVLSADSRFTWYNFKNYATLQDNLKEYWENSFA
jgi:hypothetical protein